MNRIIITFLLLMTAFALRAQELTIQSLKPTMEVLTGDKIRKDLNGNACAVVYVQTTESGLEFQGNIIGNVEFRNSQYTVYLSPGTKSLKIMGQAFIPLTVQFADYGIDHLESKVVYAMPIALPDSGNPKTQDIGENYVTFSVNPGNGAVIYIDNKDAEPVLNGEWRKRLPYGEHSYRITASGYKPESGSFSVYKGEPLQKSISLQSLMAQLSVKSATPEAQIYINDEKQGTGSYTGSLPAGKYVVEARHPSYVTYSEVVTLEESGSKTLNIPALTALTGTLDIDYSPTGATIQIDGTDYGTSPRLVYDMIVGTHNVKLIKDGYETATLTTNVKEGAITTLKGTLNKQETNNSTNESELDNKMAKKIYKLGKKKEEKGYYEEAVRLYKQAAVQGYAEAQYNLGWCYANGKGVTEDYFKAVEWYQKAADQGIAGAQNCLGWCYEYGKGVDKDISKAIEWYKKAAAQGEASAKYRLKKLQK